MTTDGSPEDRGRSLITATRQTIQLTQAVIDLTRGPLDDTDPAHVSVLPGDGSDPPPDATLQVADLLVAGRYLPAGAGAEPVAGDFYDVIQVGPDRLVLVVGDVSGHGPAAAGRMRALRTASRTVALSQVGPQAALAALDRFMDSQADEGLATLWYGDYTPSTGQLAYASAGHPPPVLARHGHPGQLLEIADAPPLGVGVAHALARRHQLHLPPSAVLAAYSDGLVERHDADLADQLTLLRQVVAAQSHPTHGRTPQMIADRVLDELVPDPAAAADDVCLVVIRRCP